jgi:GntR family transcriptional regulator
MSDNDDDPPGRPEFLPLYAQIQALLTRRIGDGAWKPGEPLPTEFALAAEYGVSQGTVRKALIALERDKLIVRRQGVGTFVTRHERDTALFHFFRITTPDGRRLVPRSRAIRQSIVGATREQADRLGVERGARLHSVVRVRLLQDQPAIYERIFTPLSLVPALDLPKHADMAEEMYVIYQERYGLLIARVAETLRAIAAGGREAQALGIDAGTPLIEIERVAYDVKGRPVELRISACDTRDWRYSAEVY